jgi:AraC family transcriptional regulator
MTSTEKDNTYFEDGSIKIKKSYYSEFKNNMQPHNHDYLSISLLLSGSLIEHTTSGTTIAKPGSLLIKPSALIHSDIFTENCTILSLNIYDWKYYNLDFENWKIIQQNNTLKHFINLINNKDKKKNIYQIKEHITQKNTKCAVPIWLKKIKEIIDHHFLETLQVSRLAKDAKVHPAYLGKVFKIHFGTDIKSYQRQLKIHYAVSKITNKTANLTQIAYDSGFSDQSHFSRELKKTTSFTPKTISNLLNV